MQQQLNVIKLKNQTLSSYTATVKCHDNSNK